MQLNNVFIIFCFLSLTLFSLAVHANPRVEAGKKKASTCVACHGANGMSSNPMWPNLAGQKAAYTEKQLRAFRDGERKDPMMSTFAVPLTDEDIKDLAAYYASLKPNLNK